MNNMAILYREKQKITSSLFWIIQIGLNILFVAEFIVQVVLGQPFGNVPAGNILFIAGAPLSVLFTVYFLLIKMELRITSREIQFRFFPLYPHFVIIPWYAIKEAYLVEHKRTKFYRIYGLDLLRNRNYFVLQGRYSLRVILKSGKILYLGQKKQKS
ncbi:hypothetical protein [Sphingobacterium multivorum]|nr:hypothetical protein [Sphingobacterium multivorum]QRQ61101.1 hypothetical protein I6J33_23880 [Sphingobacterium multivorum]